MYQKCRIKKNVCVGEGRGDDAFKLSIIMHFLSGGSRTRLKNVSEIWNLDLDLAEIWILIASNKMLI